MILLSPISFGSCEVLDRRPRHGSKM